MKLKTLILLNAAALLLWPQKAYAKDVIWPDDVYQMCEEASDQVCKGKISPEMIQAVCYAESRYTADVVNGTGQCVGIAQINPALHLSRAEKYGIDNPDVYDPYTNIICATDYMWELFNDPDSEGEPYWVLMMYSMNHSNAQRKYDKQEYSNYAVSVMDMAYELEKEHGK